MRAGGHLLGPNGPGGVSLGAPGSTRNHGEAGGSQAGGAIPLPRVKSPGTLIEVVMVVAAAAVVVGRDSRNSSRSSGSACVPVFF